MQRSVTFFSSLCPSPHYSFFPSCSHPFSKSIHFFQFILIVFLLHRGECKFPPPPMTGSIIHMCFFTFAVVILNKFLSRAPSTQSFSSLTLKTSKTLQNPVFKSLTDRIKPKLLSQRQMTLHDPAIVCFSRCELPVLQENPMLFPALLFFSHGIPSRVPKWHSYLFLLPYPKGSLLFHSQEKRCSFFEAFLDHATQTQWLLSLITPYLNLGYSNKKIFCFSHLHDLFLLEYSHSK